MSAARKKPAAPDMGALKDDWGRLTEMRRQEHEQQNAPEETPTPPSSSQSSAARPTMTRRSWYVDSEVADAFQAAVDDIHFATRVPKNVVVSRLLQAATERADEVAKNL